MIRRMLPLASILLAACMHPVIAPAPLELRTALPPSDVVRVASAQLTAAGFEIIAVDARSGVVTARRSRSASAQGEDIACRFSPGSLNDSRQPVTLGISVAAIARDTATVVTLSSRTTMRNWQDGAESDLDCASSGHVERGLLVALTR